MAKMAVSMWQSISKMTGKAWRGILKRVKTVAASAMAYGGSMACLGSMARGNGGGVAKYIWRMKKQSV